MTLAALLMLASCGEREAAEIAVSNAWARPTAGSAPAAVYVTIENKSGSPDRLTGAVTDLAAMAMIHQNEFDDGIARMRMVSEINLPPDSRIELQPDGTHIMLEGLRAPLKAGESFELVLRFRESAEQTVTVNVVKPEGQ